MKFHCGAITYTWDDTCLTFDENALNNAFALVSVTKAVMLLGL